MSDLKVPMPVAVIATTDNGAVPTDQRFVAHTPDEQPNLYVRVITPLLAIAIRAANLFFIAFTGALSVAGIDPTGTVKVADFKHAIIFAAWSGFVAAFIGTAKNLVTVFGNLEGKYPLSTGSI